ncbi:MAG: MFS transporter [Chloroflexi bacterium]|nr:MFS transporter [Chloroflexota bacterium]
MALIASPKLNVIATRLPWGLHYSWVIVGLLAMVQIIGSSIGMAAGVVVAPLSDPEGGFGWSIGMIGFALMVYYLVGALFAPISGWLGDRYGARRMMFGGGVLYTISMLLLGVITEPWHFIITFSVMLSLTQSISMVPLMAAVTLWFRRRLGLGVGLLWAAGGVGTAIMAPLIGYLIGAIGWQGTFWSIGIVGGGMLILLTIAFRNRPADVNIEPYGALPEDPPEVVVTAETEKLRVKVYNQHIRRTKAFWNLPLIHGLGCAGHGIILIYSIPIAIEQGIGLVTAAVILSLISLFSVSSRFFTPIMAERYGGKRVMILALVVQGVTVLALFWATDVWMFYLFGALFGIGFGGEMSAYMVVNRQYFGTGPIARTYGFQMMGAFAGHAVATGLAGLVIYVTGSFGPILALSIVFSLVGALVVATLEPSDKVLIPDWEESLPPEARLAPAIGGVSAAD